MFLLLESFFIFVLILLVLLSGLPISFGFALITLLLMFIYFPETISFIGTYLLSNSSEYALLAVPCFILLGAVISNTKIGSDLFEAANRWLYRLPGGLATTTTVTSAVIGALCGASTAGLAAIGRAAIREMKLRGYPDTIASGCVAISGTLSILIPPSIPMIIYGIATQVSIGKLFMAGVIPGIILTCLFSLYNVFYFKIIKKDKDTLIDKKYTMKEGIVILPKVVPFLLIVVFIIYSLYFGIATATEVGAIGAIASIILSFIIYKTGIREYTNAIREATGDTVMIMFMVIMASVFGQVITKTYVVQQFISTIIALNLSPFIIFIILNTIVLLLGFFLPPIAIILIVMPLFMPIIKIANFDLIWFGVIMILNLEIGLITPPVGLNLYVINRLYPEIPTSVIIRGAIPYLLLILMEIVLLYFFPKLVLWLPNKVIG